MPEIFTIVGLGEALYDVFPDRQVLGGAPLNVAVHAHQLAAAGEASKSAPRLGTGATPGAGVGRGVVVSRIGQDDLGRQLLAELTHRGMTTEFIQTDPDRDTGKVYVGQAASPGGGPSYEIAADVAWDKLQFDPDMENLALHCEAVCFGTLAQRDGQSRNTIQRFLAAASRGVRLFDVNLRPPFYDQRTLQRGCEMATVVKLNLDELGEVARALSLMSPSGSGGGADSAWVDRQARALLKRFKLKLVAVTRGEQGTLLYAPVPGASGEVARYEQEPVTYPPAPGADGVGAGDACSAALLIGLCLRWPLERTLTLANHVGAYVASQPGGTPALPDSILAMVRG